MRGWRGNRIRPLSQGSPPGFSAESVSLQETKKDIFVPWSSSQPTGSWVIGSANRQRNSKHPPYHWESLLLELTSLQTLLTAVWSGASYSLRVPSSSGLLWEDKIRKYPWPALHNCWHTVSPEPLFTLIIVFSQMEPARAQCSRIHIMVEFCTRPSKKVTWILKMLQF